MTTVLCRLTRRQAEHLMMAPAVAGGWIDTSLDSCSAVAEVVADRAHYLALLPVPQFGNYAARVVTADEGREILRYLDHYAKLSPSMEEDAAAASAARLRELLDEMA